MLRGWCNYFRHGVSAADLQLPRPLQWWRIVGWLRKRHARAELGNPRRRYLPNWEIRDGGIEMFRPQAVAIIRYRYRGTRIPTPWASEEQDHPHQRHEPVESRMRWESHVRFGGRAGETHPPKGGQGAPARPLHVTSASAMARPTCAPSATKGLRGCWGSVLPTICGPRSSSRLLSKQLPPASAE